MKANKQAKSRRSIYWMLLRADEKARPFAEVAIYSLMVLCAITAILQFVEQKDPLPLASLPQTNPLV